jgi:aldehyde dehydrogenase (NAD+)
LIPVIKNIISFVIVISYRYFFQEGAGKIYNPFITPEEKMKPVKTINKESDYNVTRDTLQIRNKLQEQIEFFNTGATRAAAFRKKQLIKLKDVIKKNESGIMNALYIDLKKSNFESYMTEIGIIYKQINYAVAHLKKWSKPEKIKTPFYLLPARSRIIPEPYGQVLIIAPWNYPFQLLISPLIDAIAAGNVAVLKPSELAPNTSAITAKIISEAFDSSFVCAVEGGVDTTKFLLTEQFNYIFFTGGTEVGKIIMEAASKNLTPVTLELGGKSPVIVDKDAPLDLTARKIAWGKFLNAGQTCIAPDYVLVHKDIIEKLISRIEFYVKKFYENDTKTSPYYPRIINLRHFKRIRDLMKNANIAFGGETVEKHLYISPTVLKNVSLNHPSMKEEIFGPVLPVIEFRNMNDAISIIRSMPKPLALYLFTASKKIQSQVSNELPSGALVINDVIIHTANEHLPFGGVGSSGMGAYHGKYGFDTFSHKKPVVKVSRIFDFPFRYPPYKNKLRLLRFILR